MTKQQKLLVSYQQQKYNSS